jgi:hypothetical protein
MAKAAGLTKIQGEGGDACKSAGAKRAKGICESVHGLHEESSEPAAHGESFNSRQDLTNRNCTSLIHLLGVCEKVV